MTSHQQREVCSRILQGQTKAQSEDITSKVVTEVNKKKVLCNEDQTFNVKVDAVNAQEIVSELLKQVANKGKAVIKIEVQLHNE